MFQLPEAAADGGRVSRCRSAALWEVCRHDEQLPGEVAAPITDFPAAPRWTAIDVPGDKNRARGPASSRIGSGIARAFDVPDSLAGRSMIPRLPGQQSEHDGLRERPVLRLRQESLRPPAVRRHAGRQARRERDLRRASRTAGTATGGIPRTR